MENERALASEWRFEPEGDGFIYYPGLGSEGISVTAVERETFLHCSTDEWLDIIYGRQPTHPPRPYWPGLIKRMRSFPNLFYVGAAVLGIASLKRAGDTYLSLANADSYAPLSILWDVICGSLLIAGAILRSWIAWTTRSSK